MTWLSIALVVPGNVVYHPGQLAIPRDATPVVASIAGYLIAIAATLATIPLLARGTQLTTA